MGFFLSDAFEEIFSGRIRRGKGFHVAEGIQRTFDIACQILGTTFDDELLEIPLLGDKLRADFLDREIFRIGFSAGNFGSLFGLLFARLGTGKRSIGVGFEGGTRAIKIALFEKILGFFQIEGAFFFFQLIHRAGGQGIVREGLDGFVDGIDRVVIIPAFGLGAGEFALGVCTFNEFLNPGFLGKGEFRCGIKRGGGNCGGDGSGSGGREDEFALGILFGRVTDLGDGRDRG